MIGHVRPAEPPTSSRVGASGIVRTAAIEKVSVPAYRVELSDFTRSSLIERERMRRRSPRPFKDMYDIKKEMAMRAEASIHKTNAGGSTELARWVNERFATRQKAIEDASENFRSQSELLRAQLQTRMMYGPNVSGREIKKVVGPDGNLYFDSVTVNFQMPSTTNNALNDFFRARGLRANATNPNLPGGANWGVASEASSLEQDALNTMRRQARTKAAFQGGGGNLFAEEIAAEDAKLQAKTLPSSPSVGDGGLFEQEIRMRQAEREAARAAEMKILNQKLQATLAGNGEPFAVNAQAKTNAQALQSEVAYFGLVQGNIPKNFKAVSVKGIAYDATYGRYANTTLNVV